jgi:hypothetical protein
MAKGVTSGIIKLVDWRLSFAQLDKAKAFKPGQEPRYEATFLADPSREDHAAQIKALKSAGLEIAKKKWGDDVDPEGLAWCMGLSDKNPKKKKYDGYKGMFYLITANGSKPVVVSRNREPVVPNGVQWPYSGCRVNTNVTLWTQDNEFGQGVRANLRIVQFNQDDTPFGAGNVNPDEEFEALGDAPGNKSAGKGAQAADDFDI